MIITIDGPVASGKSSLAKAVAQRHGFYYLNSGLLYRAAAYCLYTYSYSLDQINELLTTQQIRYDFDGNDPHIYFTNKEITLLLKTAHIDQVASKVSVDIHLRRAITELQKLLVEKRNAVVEGRDCGTVVFPDADIKFFITASLSVRAQRWLQDQHERGNNSLTLEQAVASIAERDKRDVTREISPLRIPDGAIEIDTTNYSFAESADILSSYIKDYEQTIKMI